MKGHAIMLEYPTLNKERFRSVSIKTTLVRDVEDFIKMCERYHSVAEFMSEAARLRLEELEKLTPQQLFNETEKSGGKKRES